MENLTLRTLRIFFLCVTSVVIFAGVYINADIFLDSEGNTFIEMSTFQSSTEPNGIDLSNDQISADSESAGVRTRHENNVLPTATRNNTDGLSIFERSKKITTLNRPHFSFDFFIPKNLHNATGTLFDFRAQNHITSGVNVSNWTTSCTNVQLTTPTMNGEGKFETTLTGECTTTVPATADIEWRANPWLEIVVGSKRTKIGDVFEHIGRTVKWNETVEADCVDMALWTGKAIIWMHTDVVIENEDRTSIRYDWLYNNGHHSQSTQKWVRSCPSTDDRAD